MKRIAEHVLILLLGIVTFGLPGCGKSSDSGSKESPNFLLPEDPPLRINLSMKERHSLSLAVQKVKHDPVAELIYVPCDIEVRPNSQEYVGTLVHGRISALFVEENHYVKKGQVLAYVESAEVNEAISSLFSIAAELRLQEQELERREKLGIEKIVSEKQLQESRSQVSVLRTKWRSARQRSVAIGFTETELDRILADDKVIITAVPIRSKLSGLIAQRMVILGQPVNPSESLFHIVDLDTVVASGAIFEPDFGKVALGQSVSVRLGAFHNEIFHSHVHSIGSVVNDVTHSLPIRALIKNRNTLIKPSMHGEMVIEIISPENALNVPESAVIQFEKRPAVFIALADTVFELRWITVTTSQNGIYAVKEGLTDKDSIVTEQVYHLKARLLALRNAGGAHD